MKRIANLYVLVLGMFLIVGSPGMAWSGTSWQWPSKQLKQLDKLETQVVERDGRFELETKRWRIRTEVSPRFTAELGLFMDLFAAQFDFLLGALGKEVLADEKPTVLIFKDHARYEEIFKDGTRGFFRYQWDGGGKWIEFTLYSYVGKDAERQFASFYHPILLHEGTHALLRRLFAKTEIPLWFNEGLATYLQFWELRENGSDNLKTRYARSSFRDDLKRCFRNSKPTLASLLATTDWNPDEMGPIAKGNYAMAESIIDFLLASDAGRKHFATVFKRLKSLEAPLTSAEIERLEPLWHKHVEKVAPQ